MATLLHSLSSHTSDKLFSVCPELENMHPEFLELFKVVAPELLEAALLKHLVAPPADLSPLLLVLLSHSGCTLLGSRIQSITLATRGERRARKEFDWIICSEFKLWPVEIWTVHTLPSSTAQSSQT